MRSFAVKALRGFGYLWFTIAALVILAGAALEFYRGGFWHGYEKVTEWFSPFNVHGVIANLITFAPGLLALWGAEKLTRKAEGKL